MRRGVTEMELFDACDTKKRGWLTLQDLQRVCPHLTHQQLLHIFDKLDEDKDGKIDKNEFTSGFASCLSNEGLKNNCITEGHLGGVPPPTVEILGPSDETYYDSEGTEISAIELPCQEEVLALYEELQNTGVPQLLGQFEKVMGSIVKEMKEQKEQTTRLQCLYLHEKELHSKQLDEVETELDKQLAEVEEKARKAEREKLEREKEEMRLRMEEEIAEMHNNIKKLQRMEEVLANSSEKTEKFNEMKHKLQELMRENLGLKGSLTGKQTEITLIKAKLASIREEYDDRCLDLESEKETLYAYIQEQDNLTRQLTLLNDANTKLHDTNDSLREHLDNRAAFCKQYNLRLSPGDSPQRGCSRQASLSSSGSCSKLRIPRYKDGSGSSQTRNNETDDDIDSGLARSSDVSGEIQRGADLDSDLSCIESDFTGSETETNANTVLHIRDWMESSERKSGASTFTSASSASTLVHEQVARVRKARSTASDVDDHNRSHLPSIREGSAPDRTFRVVLSGDAAVGKSSILMRLIKNTFTDNLQSTLGVDFQMKTLLVDEKVVAMQLWDTAGQERFRSLCKSYFRRADGAMLVFDCTSEQSFLNVRDWVQTIQESCDKQIPILICCNKVDMRILAASQGRRVIKREEGEKLAKSFNAIYMETSAKDGTNVVAAAEQLTRELLACEDFDVRHSSLVLRPRPTPVKSSCYSCNKS